MTLEFALRCTEILLGFALFQQNLEFLRAAALEKKLALVRAPLAILLMLGFYPLLTQSILLATSILLVWRFRGPYNGGSDTMSILVLLCLWLVHWLPWRLWQEIALGYVAIQLALSYFQAGWVKLVNPEWRSGKALSEVFAFTAYPVSENLRGLAARPRVLFAASWLVIIGELLFPLTLVNSTTLVIGLVFTGLFHFANAILFGLNRFFWSWLAAYPIIIWFQSRLMELL